MAPTVCTGGSPATGDSTPRPFRILGMAVDSSGKVVAQRIEWVPGGVPGFGSVYFEIDHLPAAPSYRVTVWDSRSSKRRARSSKQHLPLSGTAAISGACSRAVRDS